MQIFLYTLQIFLVQVTNVLRYCARISIIINVILIHQHPAVVDPTLRDLDQLQLVSFIQSFGIPVDSAADPRPSSHRVTEGCQRVSV